MDERVRVAHDLDRPVPLADEVADDLDAVAAEVDDRAAACQPAIPEPRGMRSWMRLARADPRHVADRPAFHSRDRLEGLRRVDEILQVAGEHARRLDGLEHPLGLVRVPAERLGAQHGLARPRGQRDRLLVEEIRQPDDDDVGVRVIHGSGDVGGRFRDAPALLECGAALRAARVDDLDPVSAALAVQRHRVEVADQPGAEQRDAVALHGCLLQVVRPRTRSRPATSARSLARVAQRAVWLKPQSGTSVRRSGGTPAATTASMRSATSSGVSM